MLEMRAFNLKVSIYWGPMITFPQCLIPDTNQAHDAFPTSRDTALTLLKADQL